MATINPKKNVPAVDTTAKIIFHTKTGKNTSLNGPVKTSIKFANPTNLICPCEYIV